MFGSLSSGLKLTDLNDFITPSQECIKPLKEEMKVEKVKGIIKIEDNTNTLSPQYNKTKITLNDCLACSGCITSAEVVLVNEQSLGQLYELLQENGQKKVKDQLVVALSLSSQAVLSLSARYDLNPQEMTQKLIGYFRSIGVNYVFDISFARCFSIIEAQREFVEKYKLNDTDSPSLPLLASACPGWVCYAEKTHGSFILPHISSVRSPQQVMGSLIKTYWSKKILVPPDKIYHATLMPCFDKKLEASREQFYMEEFQTRQVDCVITSVEVEQLLDREKIDLKLIEDSTFDQEFSLGHGLMTHDGSGSGGFSHHVFCFAAKQLFGIDVEEMQWSAARNNDMQEINLEVNGEAVLRFAIANGFRNIQNLVQKIKRKKTPYHYVEIMACPSGCLNGGAQIRPTSTGKSSKELLRFLESLYSSLPKVSPEIERKVQNLYSEWLGDSYSSQRWLHTTYKEVEKSNNPLGIKW